MRWIAWCERHVPLVQVYRYHLTPAQDISLARHVQLLEMTHDRLVYSFNAMPFVALAAVGFYGSSHDATWLALWGWGYCAAFFVSQRRLRAYQRDKTQLDPQELLPRWHNKLSRVAGLHGLALCLPLVLTLHDPSFEFSTFWYLNLAAVVALNATHQTPVLSIFTRFFNCSWNVATLLVPLVYPDRWYFVGLAILMYTFGMYRHALSAHQFFLQQVRLEETSTRLAEQFKQAKEQAEDALQEKSRFLATASHDLRQPVHAMGMLVHALLQRNQDASLTPALRDLSSSVRTMSTLFNSLLDLSKLESGAQRIDLQEMDLRKSVREVMALFEGQAQQQGLTLHLHLPKRAARVMADANLLRQIFINLLQNALRYTPRGGILVGIRRRKVRGELRSGTPVWAWQKTVKRRFICPTFGMSMRGPLILLDMGWVWRWWHAARI